MTKSTKTHHYTYIIRHINGRYYVGRRSTKKDPLLDPYMGSGVWVKGIKDKSTLTKDIIAYYASVEELKIAEMELIEKYFDDVYCMNMLYSSCGGCVGGDKHPLYGRTGELSPRFGTTHTDQTKQLMSDAKIGELNHNFGKTGELSHNFGRIHTQEHRRKNTVSKTGEKHFNASITEIIVKLIKIRISEGVKDRPIAEEYNTTQSVVAGIRHKRTWKHVTI